METDHLIARLSAAAAPVQRLPSPLGCLAIWLALSVPYMALIVILMSPRADLGAKLLDATFAIEQSAALATGILAALAAFSSVVPGLSRRLLVLAVISWAIWFASVGVGCLKDAINVGVYELSFSFDLICLPATTLVGFVPAVVMVYLLRRGAPLYPYLSAFLGGLAAAGLGNFGLRLFHPQDASLMVLVWQLGSVMLLTVAFGLAGPKLLSWSRVNQEARSRLGL